MASQSFLARIRARGVALSLIAALLAAAAFASFARGAGSASIEEAALYPRDDRRMFGRADEERFPGAGVLMCYTDAGALERAAAGWLIGSRDLVVVNAHNFIDRQGAPTRPVGDCFFRIAEQDLYFDPESLRLGPPKGTSALHITDDWALLRLLWPAPDMIRPQPEPDASGVATGAQMRVTMVSPAGHGNSRLAATLEPCEIHRIDAATETHVRRARHDCNDGYGGSGSGLFDEQDRLIAMHSASLDMNARRPFDIEAHYGSALLFEGDLLAAIRERLRAPR
ncbi:serine protease [Methylosinus sp. Sm6]|nr:serine protease [Methylosinus sp. Sm6]